jgi:nicotinamide riboside kinase
MRRFAITGPESSGKTTLTSALAEQHHGSWIPEFAREYITERNGIYTIDDLDIIAQKQFDLWKGRTEDLVFCDTDMTVMKVWSEFKYGACSALINSLFDQQQFDHYFLCRPDIAWEEDPLREHPEQREELFEIYRRELSGRNLPFSIIEGDLEQRLEDCFPKITGIQNKPQF